VTTTKNFQALVDSAKRSRARWGIHAGRTNAEVLREYGALDRGSLYRVGFRQGLEGDEAQFIGEFTGLTETSDLPGEVHYGFIMRNPVLPDGSAPEPFHVLPIDVWHLSPAEPGDMDTLLVARIEGEGQSRDLRLGWG
jgi:hypothetical protein